MSSHLHRQIAAAISIADGGTANADIEKGYTTEHLESIENPETLRAADGLDRDVDGGAGETEDPKQPAPEGSQRAELDAFRKKQAEDQAKKQADDQARQQQQQDQLSDADRKELEAFRAEKAAADAQRAADKAKQDAADRKARWLSDPLAINRQVLTTTLVDSGLSDDQIADVLKRQPKVATRAENQAKADSAPPAPADQS